MAFISTAMRRVQCAATLSLAWRRLTDLIRRSSRHSRRRSDSVELASDFGKYLSLIEPDEDAVGAAKSAHEKVRERLRDDAETKDAHKDTFLSGSYARHTAIHDINDVDVI